MLEPTMDDAAADSPDPVSSVDDIARPTIEDSAPSDEILDRLQTLTDDVRSMGGQLTTFRDRAEGYESLIRQMQSRMEALQGDQVRALLLPLVRRLAGLHAQAVDAEQRARAASELAQKDLDFFIRSIEEALELLDIEPVAAEVGIEFDPARHHAVRSIPTTDPELDRRVQRVVRQGFRYVNAARVLLPAQVNVYKSAPIEEPRVTADESADDTIERGETAT